MITVTSRGRLLAGAALGLGLSALAPQQAMAACTVTPAATPVTGTVTCATTTTTDTTYAGVSPSPSRNYNVSTAAGDVTATIGTGEVVDGYGLAFTNTVGGANTLNIVNNGSVSLTAGAPTQAPSAALQVTAIGATAVNYSGTGSVDGSTNGNGLGFDLFGTGNLTANVGGNATSGVGNNNITGDAIYVEHNGTAGDVAVTTAAGTTLRADWVGAFEFGANAANTGSFTLTNNAAVLSLTGAPDTLDFGVYIQNTGLGAVSVINNGAIGSATDRIVNTAIGATIENAASTADVSVTGSGAVFSAGTGIFAANAGTGTTTVNYTGAINTTGATGVDVDAAGGATTVTLGNVTADTNAVDVTSTGAQTITLNGVTTGTTGSGLVTDTTGARTITVGATGNVTGGTQAILLNNTGATTLTIAAGGTVGSGATGLAINDAGGGDQTITNNGTLNGLVTLGAGADTLTNAGTMNVNGVLDFGADADRFVNTGTLNVLGNTSFVGLENFGTGTTQANAGVINIGAGFTLTGPAIAFTNAGTIDTAGNATLAGFTTFSNSGTLDLAAGTFTVPAAVFTNTGTIRADEGATTITGQTSFANSGTIDLQDGATGDVLTINSSFAGSGGSNLLVDFTDTASDRLVITGATTGTTVVNADQVGGGLLNLDGLLVVDTTSTTSNFALGTVTVGGVVNPLVDYSLVQEGTDYFLVSAPNQSLFDPLAVPVLAGSLWYQSADEVIANTRLPAVTSGFSFWGQIYGGKDEVGDHDTQVIQGVAFDTDNEIDVKRLGVQAGVDYGWGNGRIGLTGGWAKAKADHDNASDLKANGWNLGMYGQFGGPIGFHGELLAKYDRYNIDFGNGLFHDEDADARSFGFDGALGYRFGLGGSATLDANVGVSHVRTKIDDFDAYGFSYDLNSVDSTRGRAGIRAEFGGGWKPYLDATVYHEFDGKGRINLFDGAQTYDLDAGGKGTWVRLEGGITGGGGPGPMLALWGDIGHKQGFGLRAGWRLGGQVAEAVVPPPPPPPPAPPPPATQTCPDGSVILATDACPAPPPPPPPPPPPAGERG